MPLRRTLVDIQSDGKFRLENNTPISDFSTISFAGNINYVISKETEKIYDEVEYLNNIFDPTKTYGRGLDNIGFTFGNMRGDSTISADMTDTNFYFYLDTRLGLNISTLINRLYPISTHFNILKRMEDQEYIDSATNPTQLRIPAGTTISNNDTTIVYTTVEEIFITSTSSEVYTPVIATVEGVGGNIESNVLIKHSLNEIDTIRGLAKYILCSNRYPITNGRDPIVDNEYRYNITLGRSNKGSNEVAIRQAVLAIPGVRNVLFERGRFGNGTFNLIIEGVSPIVSEGLIRTVKERVKQIVGGDSVFASRPEYLGIELSIDLITNVGNNNLGGIRESVRSSIIQYINDVPIGGEIIWNQIVNIITSVTGVKDFILSYFRLGEYDIFNKINKNKIVLRKSNQRARHDEKFYCDKGLINICVKEQG